MTHFKFTEGQTETRVEKHHTRPYSLPIMKARELVCWKVREKLETFWIAKCDGCENICVKKTTKNELEEEIEKLFSRINGCDNICVTKK